ncbi:hypothetical protein UFOVP847_29 [uncultured Caudovirales phage]|uniref:Uncharacterized protein n=1 Tax=uncultured Caudovirales phage TaxID=2100421 RepID=A0A6J5P8V5_9CAUD|nr:hypothetical protein UFOVP847_29 [uncultured Caudovirales phage]
MAMLPRYERLGVRAAQPAQLDFANIREQANAAQSIGQSLGRMADFAFGFAEKKAEQRAKQTVADLGAVETLSRIQKAGGPTTTFDTVAFQSANRIASAEIQMQSDKDINSLLQDAQKNGMSIADVSAHLADITDGYAATLSTLDPDAAGMLRIRIAEASDQAIQRYGSYVESQAKAARSARVEDAGKLYAANMMQTALIPGITPETLYTMSQNRMNLLIDAGVSPDKAATWAASALKDAVTEHAAFSAMTMPLADLKARAMTPPDKPLPGLDYTDTLSLWSKSSTIYNTRTESLRVDATTLSDQLQAEAKVLGSGGTPDPIRIAALQEKAQALAEFDPSLAGKVANLQADITFVSGVRGMNVDELNSEVTRLSAGVPGVGGPGLDTTDETTMLNFATQTRDAAQKALDLATADALKADKEAAGPIVAQISTAIDVLGQQLDQTNPNPAVVQLAITEITAQIAKVPESQMTPELLAKVTEIKQISKDFADWRGMTSPQQNAFIQKLAQDIPAQTPPGMTAMEALAMNGRRAKLLMGLQASQSDAIAKGDALLFAQTQRIQLVDAQGNAHVVGQPLDFSSPEAVAQSFERRLDDVTKLETRFGASGQNIFLPQEKAQFTAALESGTVGQQLVMLDAIVRGGGPTAERILGEIGADKPIYAHVGGLVADGSMETAQVVLRGLKLEKPTALSGNDPKNTANEYLGGALYSLPKYRDSVIVAADAMYADYAAQNPSAATGFDSEKYNEFIDAAMGNMTVSNEFASPALVPRGLTPTFIDLLSDPDGYPDYGKNFLEVYVSNKADLVDFPIEALPGSDWYPFNLGQENGKTVWTLRSSSNGMSVDWADKNNTRIKLDLNKMVGGSQ